MAPERPQAQVRFAESAGCVSALAQRFDRYFAPLAATKDLSGTLFIAEGDAPPVVCHYGYADMEQRRVLHTPETRYSAASVTKGITAATLISLQREGRVSLDDVLGDYVPGFTRYPELTLRDVLQHRAGLPRDLPDDFELASQSVSDWVLAHPELMGPAGEERYSNVGYSILAEVIEAATGLTFAEAAGQRVLASAGMTASVIDAREASQVENGALPYTAGPDPRGVMRPVDAPLAPGASGLVTTAADLAVWVRYLADDGFSELFTGKGVAEDNPLGSIDVGTDVLGEYVSVQGSLPGYSANAIAWRDRPLTISYVGNLFSYPVLGMGRTLRALLANEAPMEPPVRPDSVEVTPQHLDFMGVHTLPDFGEVEIKPHTSGAGMRLKVLGRGEFWTFFLTPIENGELYWRSFDRTLRIEDLQ